jgi:hypothetical protein
MAVNGITNSNSINLLRQKVQTTIAPLQNEGVKTPTAEAIQQNALLVNETLGNLGVTTAKVENPLLINEVPAALAVAEITEGLPPVPQNSLFINEILQGLGFTPRLVNPLQPRPGAAPAITAAEAGIIAAREAAVVTPPADLTLAAEEPFPPIAATAAAPVSVPTAPGVEEEAALPVTGRFLSQEFNPATMPVVLFPYQTPSVLAVHHFVDPTPQPGRLPEPIGGEVKPVAPSAVIHAVGNARFRQALRRARAREHAGNVEYNKPLRTISQVEKVIRHALGLVNADMSAHDSPLHLVFARHENGFALDVYDCSYGDACRITYDVPISLDNLGGVLDNLEHETGIIIDTDS